MTLPRRPRGTISGRVIMASGQTIINAAVSIIGNSPPHTDIAALTDEQGEYSFDDLIPGDYNLLVNVAGFSRQVKRVRVDPGSTVRLDFVVR